MASWLESWGGSVDDERGVEEEGGAEEEGGIEEDGRGKSSGGGRIWAIYTGRLDPQVGSAFGWEG